MRLDPDKFVAGELDLVGTLAALNRSGAAERMQRAIAANAHRLMYSLRGFYKDDATDTLLRAMASALKSPGGCKRVFGSSSWRCRLPKE